MIGLFTCGRSEFTRCARSVFCPEGPLSSSFGARAGWAGRGEGGGPGSARDPFPLKFRDVVAEISSVSIEATPMTAPEGSVSTDPARIAAQRRARIRLLTDLVQHGLYRIDTDQLANMLLDRYRVDLL